jgi:aminopeptidase N
MFNQSIKMKNYVLFIILFLSFSTSYSQVNKDSYPKDLVVDILNYDFSISLSDATDEIFCKNKVTLAFIKESIGSLKLDLINISDSTKKGMIVSQVTVGNKSIKYSHVNNRLEIPYPDRFFPGDLMEIIIDYHGIPADAMKIGPNKYGDRCFFTENWPNRARHWLPVIDHPYEKATCSFKVTAPAHYEVISNGLKREESILESGQKLTHWVQSVPISSWLYVMGAAQFAIDYYDTFEGKSLESWVYPKDRDIGFRKFSYPMKQSLAFFSDYVGPFVYEKLANIMATSVGGGMETASAVFYGETAFEDRSATWLKHAIVHENAHQWFGNSVTEYDWDDVWLSEGFATFFTLLFREHAYGLDDYRQGLIDSRKRMTWFFDNNPEYAIIDDNIGKSGSPTSGATYQKGAWVLHMLRTKIGDVAFKKGIRSYYARFMNSNTTTNDFVNEMELASGTELNPFFEDWLYQGGIPILKCEWQYDEEKKEIHFSVEQTQEVNYDFGLQVSFGSYKNDLDPPVIHNMDLSFGVDTASFPLEFRPVRVRFDPEVKLLAKWDISEKKDD